MAVYPETTYAQCLKGIGAWETFCREVFVPAKSVVYTLGWAEAGREIATTKRHADAGKCVEFIHKCTMTTRTGMRRLREIYLLCEFLKGPSKSKIWSWR